MGSATEIMSLQSVACDLCEQDRSVPIFLRPDSMSVVECVECGLLYLNPRPTQSTVEAWYTQSYFDGASAGLGYTSYFGKAEVASLLKEAETKLAILGNHVNLKGATVLELGCATGDTTCALWTRGANVIGCDLSADAIRIAHQRYPMIEFRTSSVDRLQFASGQFDVVIAFELIEHVLSPAAFVEEVHRLLKPGGVLALTTPNAGCGRRIGWKQWSGFATSLEHLYFFDTSTLAKLLSLAGMSRMATYSQGTGKVEKPKTRRLKHMLKRTGLFAIAKASYRAICPQPTLPWVESQDFHTLMMLARKP